MDVNLIEKLDSRRYKYMLWQTIGFGIFFPGIFLREWISASPSHAMRIVFAIITLFGSGLWLAGLLLVRSNERRINRDTAVKEALNNEMIIFYGYKALKQAFFVTLLLMAVLCLLSEWWLTEMTAVSACLIMIYTAVIALKIAQLVYLKR